MQTITKYLVLLVLCLNVQLINAQDSIKNVNNQERINELKRFKSQIEAEEKAFLKTEVEAINLRLEKGEINFEKAQELKKEAAQKRALNIENRIVIINNKIALLERNQEGYDPNDGVDQSKVGFEIGGGEGFFAGLNIEKNKNKPKKYDLRTTSDFVLAVGLNNAIIEGENLDDSPYKFGGSRFFEMGWAWKTRVFKESNFLRFKYGYSLQFNSLKPENNRYFVNEGGQTVLQEFPENLRKSKLAITNLVFPMHFEFGPSTRIDKENYFRYSTRKKFKIGLGGYAGVNIGARQKLKYETDGQRFKDKQKGGLNVSSLVYGLSGYVAFKEVGLYVKYDLSPIFKDQIVEQNNISFGIRFDMD